MRFGSMFSGIEAASVAWKPLGWDCQWVCEIEPFPCSVLAHHYPDVPNLGNVMKVNWDEIRATRPVDIMVFGSPCQSFSVAGKRLGLDDPRGNLALYSLSVVKRLRPRWFVFENVPGLLSSDGGRDFGRFLAAVGECGYQCAWRILDAQYFGVAQRRRRVFVIGCLGDWRRAAAVLFERHSLSGHPAPGKAPGEGNSAAATFGIDEECNVGADQFGPLLRGGQGGTRQAVAQVWPAQVASTLNAAFGKKLGLENQHINEGAPLFVPASSQIRRITPIEAERLQGFPDNYTNVNHCGRQAPDGSRYKALGNSMAVPVMAHIGRRIALVDELTNAKHKDAA